MRVDFGLAAQDYASHRAGFPESLFERLEGHGLGRRGQVVIDLGSGTGSLGRGFARRGCRVIGLDRSADLLGQARRLDCEAGLVTGYLQTLAERAGLAPGQADLVCAGQCWHWFDRAQAAEEARRLLKPGGKVLLAHFDWIPQPGNLPERTEELILQHNPDWARNPAWTLGGRAGIYPGWLADLSAAGFAGLETFSYDVEVPYTPEGWRGRIRASAGVGASLPSEEVERFDRALKARLEGEFPGEGLQVPHRVWALVGRVE